MRRSALLIMTALLLMVSSAVHSDEAGLPGKWYAIAEDGPDRGRAISHIEIYEKNGRYYGRIAKLLVQKKDAKCQKCTGDRKDQPILGMVVLWEMNYVKTEGGVVKYDSGKILDVNTGKTYQCAMWLYNDNKIKVRYYYFPMLFRTVWWYRHSK